MPAFLKLLRVTLLNPILFAVVTIFCVLLFKLSVNAGPVFWFHPLMYFFSAGLLSRLLIKFLFKLKNRREPFEFVDTLEHELTHVLFGYITLSPPSSLKASADSGGEVRLKRKNFLVMLSPYLFPLFTGLSFLVGLFLRPDIQTFWNRVTAVLMGSFVYRLGTEIRWYQEDLREYGVLFSGLLILLVLLTESLLFIKFTVGIDFPFWKSFLSQAGAILSMISDCLK